MPTIPGDYEIRYVANPEARVLAKIPIVITEAKATVDTHEKVVAGAELEVDWTGPGGGSDRILLVPADQAANDDAVKSWRTDRGTPARLLSPETPGQYEVRYANRDGKTLARQTVMLTEARAVFGEIPREVGVSQAIPITWEAANHPGDRVLIMPKTAADRDIAGGISANGGSPKTLRAPAKPGDYELRYVTGQSRKVLARVPILVK